MDKWKRIQEDFEGEDVYIVDTCVLQHTLDLDSYVNGANTSSYVSIMLLYNSSGCDKKLLSVFGQDTLEPVTSLAMKYYNFEDPKVTLPAIYNQLSKWNDDLVSEGRHIKLLISLPEHIVQKIHFTNIKLEDSTDLDVVTSQAEKITQCFKYHYRKLQILKNIVHGNDAKQMSFLDYANMMISAWHNVSNNYIHHLFYPFEDGSPNIDDEERNLSLMNWCTKFNVPIDTETDLNVLDQFVYCDHKLESTNFAECDNIECNEVAFDAIEEPTSAIEAYQAMKRLLSYLQGEGAQETTIKSAKMLEDYLELRSMKELQEVVAQNN